jgi:hypothetical protein
MPVKLEETRTDHRGDRLPPGVYALVAPDGAITGYKVRWREEDDDGVRRNRAKRFSAFIRGVALRTLADARVPVVVLPPHAALEPGSGHYELEDPNRRG